MQTIQERKQELLDALNKTLELVEPITYAQFNTKIAPVSVEKLQEFEKLNPKVGLCNLAGDQGNGISTLTLLATVTDYLCDQRICVLVEDSPEQQIVGFAWYEEPKEQA
jgi:DNA-binding NarL/FixJ family response regulator